MSYRSSLLNTTSPRALEFRQHFDGSAQGSKDPDPAPLAPPAPDSVPQAVAVVPTISEKTSVFDEIPISLYLMSKMFEGVINLRYARRVGDIGVHAFVRDDDAFGIGFYPMELEGAAPVENDEPFDVYAFPDYHDSVQNFLTDLTEFAPDDVELMFDSCGFISMTKLGMYEMLADYVSDPAYAISTPDTVFMATSNFDPDIESQQRLSRMRDHDRTMRDVYANLPRFRQMTDNIDPLFVANNTPATSLAEFHHVSFMSANAELPCALSHILQTICQEDRLDHRSLGHIRVGERLTYGGYN